MRRLLSTEFTVGTFALLGLLVIIYMSLKVNDRGSVGSRTNIYKANFDTVSGLVRKVPVEVSGIPVGFVDDIELQDNKAIVLLKVNRDVKIFADSSVYIRDRGILGDRFVQLNPGSTDQPQLKDGDTIPKALSKSDFEQIADALNETATTIKELVRSDNPKGALGKVVVNLRDMTSKLNDIVGENNDRVGRILKNMESFSEDMKNITGDNKDQIHTVLVALGDVSESLKDVLGKDGSIAKATTRFDNTMASLERIVSKVERGEGTVGKLINDETTVNKVNDTMDNINDTFGLFRKIQLSVRYRGEWFTGAEKLQNMVGITIAPAPDKFLLFEIIDSPGGSTKVIHTIVNSGGTTISDTQVVQSVDELLFSIELAKKFWDFTLRFGLIRSQGGVGMDYSLFDDKFVISVEAFDFNRPQNRAHVRAYGTIYLYKHLLLTGGADDLMTKFGSHNAFFGAGIQFTDQDLKALVTLLPRSGV